MTEIKYGLNEAPPALSVPAFGLQHVLTMLGATVAVPSIIAGAYGLDASETSKLISSVLFVMGFATLLQVTVGSRLPLIQGSSFAFLPAMLYVSTLYSGNEGLAYAAGAFMIGSVIQFFLGFSQVAGRLQSVLTPVVIGPTVIVIGLSLFGAGGGQAAGNWWIASLTIILIAIFSFGIRGLTGLSNRETSNFSIKTVPVVLAIFLVWVFSLILTVLGVFSDESVSAVRISQVAEQSWFRLPEMFPWGLPRFDFNIVLIFIIAYLVSTVESIGDYNAINEITSADGRLLEPKQVNRGILAEGIACFFAGVFGANPTTSYSENIGVVGITGIASRVVIIAGAIILIIAGLLPKVGGFLATIPSPIMGGLYCVLFGMIAGVGIRYASKANLNSMRNVSIMGLALFLGFALPAVFSNPDTQANIAQTLGQNISTVVIGIVTSNMAVTALTALILDRLLQDS